MKITHGHKRRFVYTLTGPSGVYVGCCIDVAVRMYQHRAKVDGGRGTLRIHELMRAEGFDAYRLDVVACCPDLNDGLATERAIMVQLARTGANVINTWGLISFRKQAKQDPGHRTCSSCASLRAEVAELRAQLAATVAA